MNKIIIGIAAAATLLATAGTGAVIAWGVAGDRPTPIVVATVTTVEAPVCHAATEDSVIKDCDYRDGAWHRR